MKRIALALLALASMGVAWDATWEGRPIGSEPASDLDLFIREFKLELGDREQVEHIFGVGTDDNGLARMGSSRCFLQTTAPTDVTGLGPYTGTVGVFASTLLSTDEPGATTRDIGAGRCWIDTDGPDGVVGTADDFTVAYWSETANLFITTGAVNPAATVANQRIIDPPGRVNLLYNGSFQATGGTGGTGVTTTPAGWADEAGPATYAYVTPPAEATEGEGVELVFTGVGANSGIAQTVILKASTTYFVTARVDVGAAGDICRLDTNGAGGTEMTDADATATTYQTVSGSFVTGAALDTLTIRLVAVVAGDICRVANVTLYETVTSQVHSTSPAGTTACRSTSVDNTVDAYTAGAFVDALVSCTVNVPGNGYLIQVTGAVTGETDNNDTGMEARIRENCNGAGAATVQNAHVGVGGYVDNATNDTITASLSYLRISNTAGDQCVYTLEAAGKSFDLDRNQGPAGDGVMPLEQPVTYIQTLLIPTR